MKGFLWWSQQVRRSESDREIVVPVARDEREGEQGYDGAL